MQQPVKNLAPTLDALELRHQLVPWKLGDVLHPQQKPWRVGRQRGVALARLFHPTRLATGIVHWAGVRMADFLEMYPPERINGKDPRYVCMETPNGDYYTGYGLDVMRPPQTLLVTEMMGVPLTQPHGAPLRLHMPTKYG